MSGNRRAGPFLSACGGCDGERQLSITEINSCQIKNGEVVFTLKIGSIKKTALDTGVPEWVIRQMVKSGECPGFYSGVKFLVNQELFLELIESKCRRHLMKSDIGWVEENPNGLSPSGSAGVGKDGKDS